MYAQPRFREDRVDDRFAAYRASMSDSVGMCDSHDALCELGDVDVDGLQTASSSMR